MTKSILVAVTFISLSLTTNLLFAQDSSAHTFIAHDEAGAHVHGSHVECPLPKTTLDVVRCAQEEHPRVQRAKLSLNQARGLGGVATQWQNPELDIESVSGSINGEKRAESKLALLVPVEIGGKRAARKLEAESQEKLLEAGLKDIQADITIETVTKFHRLRQMEVEKALLQDSIETFSQVVSQQKSRPGLSPEQRVALSVFKMALSEAKVRQSELFEEEKSLEHYFHISTGHSLNELKKVLPTTPKDWPDIKSRPANALSPGILLSRAEFDLALSQVKTAQAESWPEFKIGPMVQIQEEGANRGSIFGFQLTMGLPLFNLNGAGRTYARLGETRANKVVELTKAEENHERDEQLKVYERSVQTLKDTPTAEQLAKDHLQHENYARRGLISASLIIESHRQIEELTRSRHGREIKALEALWQIYKFDGRILSEAL